MKRETLAGVLADCHRGARQPGALPDGVEGAGLVRRKHRRLDGCCRARVSAP